MTDRRSPAPAERGYPWPAPAERSYRRPAPAERSYRWPAPAERGYRWPAEWEPHAATWIGWPHAPETWPGRLAQVETAFAEIVRALAGRERVRILVGDEEGGCEDRARTVLAERGVDPDAGIDFVAIATDDAWLRDTGPIFVVCGEGDAHERLALDFRFDAWGGKYPPWERDDGVASAAASWLGTPAERIDVVLEGGAIDGDGRGTLLTTEACLLHPNRGERGEARNRELLETLLAEQLAARSVLWLGEGIAGDDTDGHVDDIARFVGAGTVVAAVEADASDVNHAPLARNLERLRAMRDADGKPLAIAELPMPPPMRYRGQRLPASYANFYLANGAALVPTFGAASDERALAVLRECLPDREIVAIPAVDLVIGLGAVHCLTQQEPR